MRGGVSTKHSTRRRRMRTVIRKEGSRTVREDNEREKGEGEVRGGEVT